MPKAAQIILIAIAVVLGIVTAAVILLNFYVRGAYSDFYDAAEAEFPIPGVSEGFIDQDLDYFNRGNMWLFSGYMQNGGQSPVFRRAVDETVSKVYAAYPDGTPYEGHGSGITSSSDYVFLACDEGYLVLSAAEFADAADGDVVQAIDVVQLEVQPAFLNIEGDTLYCGNFYREPEYPSPDHHKRVTPDGTQNSAIMYAYPADSQAPYGFAKQADRVYSIPDLVQGVCVIGPHADAVGVADGEAGFSHAVGDLTGDSTAAGHDEARENAGNTETGAESAANPNASSTGAAGKDGEARVAARNADAIDYHAPGARMVLSTSWGIGSSHLLVYSLENLPERDAFWADGREVPLYFLDSFSLVDDVTAPPMTEGIEYHDGRIYIGEESASNKYLFGKLYGAGIVFSLKL